MKSNLTKVGGYLEQLLELTCWRDLVFVRFQIQKETTIVSIFSVQHHQRYMFCGFLMVCFLISQVVFAFFFPEVLLIFFIYVLKEREKYKLGSPESFHYLNQSKCYQLDGISDAKEYVTTRRAMDIVGINKEDQVNVTINSTI